MCIRDSPITQHKDATRVGDETQIKTTAEAAVNMLDQNSHLTRGAEVFTDTKSPRKPRHDTRPHHDMTQKRNAEASALCCSGVVK